MKMGKKVQCSRTEKKEPAFLPYGLDTGRSDFVVAAYEWEI